MKNTKTNNILVATYRESHRKKNVNNKQMNMINGTVGSVKQLQQKHAQTSQVTTSITTGGGAGGCLS